MENKNILDEILSGKIDNLRSSIPITFEKIFYENYSTLPENANVFEHSSELEDAINGCAFLLSKDDRAFKLSQNLVKSTEIIAKSARSSMSVNIDKTLNMLSVDLISSHMSLSGLTLTSLSVAISSSTDLLWCEDYISFSLEFEKLYKIFEL